MDASTVKWTTFDICLVLSEIDLNLNTNFKFVKENNHKHFENILIYKAEQFMMTQKNEEKST